MDANNIQFSNFYSHLLLCKAITGPFICSRKLQARGAREFSYCENIHKQKKTQTGGFFVSGAALFE